MKIPLSAIILSAIIVGFAFPYGTFIKNLQLPLLFALMYFSVLEININPKKMVRKELIIWGLINIVTLPLVAFFVGSLVSNDLLLGIVIAALAPTATTSPFFVGLIKGDKELSISISTLANLSSIFYVPIVLFILFGMRIAIPYGQVFVNIFELIFIPLFLAILTKKFLASRFNKFVRYSKSIVPFILFLILWIIFSTSLSSIESSFRVITIIPLVGLVCTSGFLLGYFSVKDKKLKRTLAIAGGFKNQSLMLGIFYNLAPITLIPPVIYLIFHHIYNGIFVWLYEKKKI
jgi:BASS family bile acid:Na+ symporter